MPGSPDVFDDGSLGPARPLTEHEQRRLNDIASWLDLTDAEFGARMRQNRPRPHGSRSQKPVRVPNQEHTSDRADRTGRATRNTAHRQPPASSGPTGQRAADRSDPAGPMAERGWNRLVQATAGLTVVLILLLVFAPAHWGVLALSVLCTFVPLLLLAIYALRLPDGPGHTGPQDGRNTSS